MSGSDTSSDTPPPPPAEEEEATTTEYHHHTIQTLSHALSIRVAGLGHDHPTLYPLYLQLARMHHERLADDAADWYYSRCLGIMEPTPPLPLLEELEVFHRQNGNMAQYGAFNQRVKEMRGIGNGNPKPKVRQTPAMSSSSSSSQLLASVTRDASSRPWAVAQSLADSVSPTSIPLVGSGRLSKKLRLEEVVVPPVVEGVGHIKQLPEHGRSPTWTCQVTEGDPRHLQWWRGSGTSNNCQSKRRQQTCVPYCVHWILWHHPDPGSLWCLISTADRTRRS